MAQENSNVRVWVLTAVAGASFTVNIFFMSDFYRDTKAAIEAAKLLPQLNQRVQKLEANDAETQGKLNFFTQQLNQMYFRKPDEFHLESNNR